MDKITYIRSQIDCAQGKTYPSTSNVCTKWEFKYRVVATSKGIEVLEHATYLGYTCNSISNLAASIKAGGNVFSDTSDISANITINLPKDIGALVDSNLPVDLLSALRSRLKQTANLPSYTNIYQRGSKDLGAVSLAILPFDLSSSLDVVSPLNVIAAVTALRSSSYSLYTQIKGCCPGSIVGTDDDVNLTIYADSCDRQLVESEGGIVFEAGSGIFVLALSYELLAKFLRYIGSPSSIAQPLSRYFSNITKILSAGAFRVAYAYGSDAHAGGGCNCNITTNSTTTFYSCSYINDSEWAGTYYDPNYIKDVTNDTMVVENPHIADWVYHTYTAYTAHLKGYMNYSKVSLCAVIPEDTVTITCYVSSCEGSSYNVIDIQKEYTPCSFACKALWGVINSVEPVNIKAGIVSTPPENLSSHIESIPYQQITGITKSITHSYSNLNAYSHSYTNEASNIQSSVSSVVPIDLDARLSTIPYFNLLTALHSQHVLTSDLSALLLAMSSGSADVTSNIVSIPYKALYTYITAVASQDLTSTLRTYHVSYIHAYLKQYNTSNVQLGSLVNPVESKDLQAVVHTGIPNLLGAYINIISISNINGVIKPIKHGSLNLHAYTGAVSPYDMLATVSAIPYSSLAGILSTIPYKALGGFVNIYERYRKSLLAAVKATISATTTLSSYIYAVAHRNITGHVYGIAPSNLEAFLYSISSRHVGGYVNTNIRSHYDIRAFSRIFSLSYKNIISSIVPVTPKNLSGYLSSILSENLTAFTTAIEHSNIIAYLTYQIKDNLDLYGFVRTTVNYRSSFRASIGTVVPSNLLSVISSIPYSRIRGSITPAHSNELSLQGYAAGVCGGGNLYICPMLGAYIDSVLPTNLNATMFSNRGVELSGVIAPSTTGLLRAKIYGVFSDIINIKAHLHALSTSSSTLGSFIGVAPYKLLTGLVFGITSINIPTSIRSTVSTYSGLKGFLVTQHSSLYYLNASAYSVSPANIEASVLSVPYKALRAYTKSVLPVNLTGVVGAAIAFTVDLAGYIKGPKQGYIDIYSYVYANKPISLYANLSAVKPELLHASLDPIKPSDLLVTVRSIAVAQRNLVGSIRTLLHGYGDMLGFITIIKAHNLASSVYSIPYTSLIGHITTNLSEISYLASIIRGYSAGISNLSTEVGPIPYVSLSTDIYSVPYKYLGSSVIVVKPTLLYSTIYSVPFVALRCFTKSVRVGTYDLQGYVNMFKRTNTDVIGILEPVPYKYIRGSLNSVTPVDISSRVIAIREGMLSMSGAITPVHTSLFDLKAHIFSTVHENVRGVLNPVPYVELGGLIVSVPYVNIYSYVKAFEYSNTNLAVAVKSVYKGYYDIGADIHTTTPVSLPSFIAAIEHTDFIGFIRSYETNYRYLLSAIREGGHSTGDIVSNIQSIPGRALSAYIGIIGGPELRGVIRRIDSRFREVNGYIHGWVRDVAYLPSTIQSLHISALVASVNVTLPINLGTYIKAYYQRDLIGILHGYSTVRLASSIGAHQPANLTGIIGFYVQSYLNSILKGTDSDKLSLLSYVKVDHEYMLGATIPKYSFKTSNELHSTIVTLPIYLLNSSIVGWDVRNLTANILSSYNRNFLHAVITVSGGWVPLSSNIKPLLGRGIYNLSSMVDSYKEFYLYGSLQSIPSSSLQGYLKVLGGSRSITATISSTTSYFNEVYSISISQTANLYATVGYTMCGDGTIKSSYRELEALARVQAVYNLPALIECVSRYVQNYSGLGASINIYNKFNYNQYYMSLTEGYKVGPIIRNNPVFNKNALTLTFNVIKGYSELSVSINVLGYNKNLTSRIVPVLLSVAPKRSIRLYREYVSVIEGSNIISDFYVDMYLAFKKQTYYVDNKIFIDDYTSTIFNLDFNRVKLEAVTNSYRLSNKMYMDSDEAIRYGINKVSGFADRSYLSGSIQPINIIANLHADIKCRQVNTIYTKPYIYVKQGVVTALGCYANSCIKGSSGVLYGAVQDLMSFCTAV